MQKTVLSLAILLVFFQLTAQTERAGILAVNEQTIGIATGIDYSILPLEVSYKRGFDLFHYKYPTTLGVNVTVPLFDFDLNDFKVKLTSEATLLRKGNFEVRGGIDPLLTRIKMKTESMTSMGADVHLFTGLTNKKWNVGLEVTYNQIFTTHIQHTDLYRDLVFEDVLDGWYKNTASNLKLGFVVGRSFNKFDLFLNGGMAKTGKMKEYLYVPTMHALIGANYKF